MNVTRSIRAFTLIETLVCICTIVIVATLTFPVYNLAKDSGHKNTCRSNLHQLWIATQLYRESNGGGAEVGDVYEMALPSNMGLNTVFEEAGNPKCQGRLAVEHKGPYGYQYMAPEPLGQVKNLWRDYVNQWGNSAILFSDWAHNDPTTVEMLEYPKLGLGVNLAGSVVTRSAVGEIFKPRWWHDAR